MPRNIAITKPMAIVSFLILLFCSYFLRSEVLALSKIRFSAENARAEERSRRLKENHPIRVAEYAAQLKHYQTQLAHYEQMLELFQTDYEEYVRRQEDQYVPPRLPQKPRKPRSLEESDALVEINAKFRDRQHQYYETTSVLNWLACLAALALVGSLLHLLLYDLEGKRLFYLVILVLSFVFMIGPSFHSILSALVGFIRAPPLQ